MMPMDCFNIHEHKYLDDFNKVRDVVNEIMNTNNLRSVSYTHLTLPTKRIV